MNTIAVEPRTGKPIEMLPELFDLSIVGLRRMFLPDRGVFCDRLVHGNDGVHQRGVSPRYTLMTLLGLHRYERLGHRSGFDVRDLTRDLAQDTEWLESIGDLGLLLWACAEVAPDLLDACVRQTNALTALSRSDEARAGLTMEMAWFLTGISALVLARPSRRAEWTAAAGQCYGILKSNRGRSGLFGHVGGRAGVSAALRGRIGSFADQVYPSIALSKYGQAFDVQESLAFAAECAQAICNAQGPQGQWWWHYDAPTGRVVQRYPVYSVHQEAMGPMALFAVKEATGKNFDQAALKGLEWIDGRNELGEDLRDPQIGVVWRCLRFPTRASMLRQEAKFFLPSQTKPHVPRGLTVLRECRPYELGWLLYAFCPFVQQEAR